MFFSGRGGARRVPGVVDRTVASRIIRQVTFTVLSGILSSVCLAEEPRDWRLLGISSSTGLSAFSDTRSNIDTFAVGDAIADGLWRIESIAADHVVLEPGPEFASRSTPQAIVLRIGQAIPELAKVSPRASVYYEPRGQVIDLDEQGDVEPDEESRP